MMSIISIDNTHVNHIDDRLNQDNLLIKQIDNRVKGNNKPRKSVKIAVKSEMLGGCWSFFFNHDCCYNKIRKIALFSFVFLLCFFFFLVCDF